MGDTFGYDMNSLQTLMKSNVVEARFMRRHNKPGWSGVRGAFVTTNFELLNGDLGFSALHFKPPKGAGMGYNHRKYNLVVGWDIFRQEYRVFAAECSIVRNFYDVSSPEERAAYWLMFRERVLQLTSREKLIYMGYTGRK